MTWITDNVLWQMPGEGLSSIVASLTDRGMAQRPPQQLLHILNPYMSESETVRRTQVLTLESLQLAARGTPGIARVAVVDAGDEHAGIGFDAVVELPNRPSAGGPQLFDVLRSGDDCGVGGDYVLFTNMDICVGPTFYHDVRQLVSLGAEALIINRRTVQGWDPDQSVATLAHLDLGEDHPGMDCFVFPRHWISEFETSGSVVGHGHVMRSLLYNLVARAEPLVVLTEVAMTYHYGDDRPWASQHAQPQFEANKHEAHAVYSALSREETARDRLSGFVAALPKYKPKLASNRQSNS